MPRSHALVALAGDDPVAGPVEPASYNQRVLFHSEVALDWREHIAVNPDVLVGKPVIKGTRIAVEFVLDLLAGGWTQEQVLASYPGVTPEDIRACLAYASEVLQEERVFPLPGA